MTDPIITIDRVTKYFKGSKNPAIDGVSANILPGQITGLVGPDGAGKTTLIRMLIGLLPADAGSITVLGQDIRRKKDMIYEITGYMPQKFGLYEDLTVLENLSLYADLRHITGSQRKEKFQQLLRFTDLEPFGSRPAGKLSGGMKQKLGLACALIGNPRLLLLDEPSVGVDPISRRELWKMVHESLSGGMAVVWSTSYLDEAEQCDTVLLLNEGQKLYDGPPADILKEVEGRTWQIRGVEASRRRQELVRLLKHESVRDGIIQGRYIRIVTAKDKSKPPLDEGQWRPVAPDFEDAFIDRLGGGPGGASQLAEQMPQKPDDSKPVIDARHLTKKFGEFTAVRDNTFQIRQGEIFGLLGPNGAGKSTTFKMMCGLLQPTEGRALVTGLDLKTAASQARSRIGYMAQKFSLYGHLTVLQNLTFFSGLYGLDGRQQKDRTDLMISLFDLKKHLNQSAKALPLGFKQRLALACSVMHQPDVLFLDEPTSGTDPITRREFWLHINAMAQKGVTVMVTTHFMDEAEYCDRIGLIYQGDNIATGSPDELKQMAVSPERPDPTLEEAFIALVRQRAQKSIGREAS